MRWVALLLVLAGCGERQDANSGVTSEEAQKLDEAEKMLDEPEGNRF